MKTSSVTILLVAIGVCITFSNAYRLPTNQDFARRLEDMPKKYPTREMVRDYMISRRNMQMKRYLANLHRRELDNQVEEADQQSSPYDQSSPFDTESEEKVGSDQQSSPYDQSSPFDTESDQYDE